MQTLVNRALHTNAEGRVWWENCHTSPQQHELFVKEAVHLGVSQTGERKHGFFPFRFPYDLTKQSPKKGYHSSQTLPCPFKSWNSLLLKLGPEKMLLDPNC